MGLNIGITNDYLKNNASVPENLQKYILWAKAREGGSPGLKPSLDLDFARNKSLIDNVTGQNLVTFTRASSATYFDSQGVLQTATTDVPRFDHNPVTGESLGLLVEEARTNLVLRSEELGTTWTTAAVSVTADQRVAPNGQLSMDTVTATGGSGYLQQTVTVANSTVFNFSIYAYSVANRIRLIIHNGTSDICNISWTSLSAGTTSATGTSTNIVTTPIGNSIYRLSFSFTSTSTTANVRIQPLDSSGAAVTGATADCWGAQLEAGSFPTSYIPTTTSAVTRAADVASISGSNFSGWYRQDEGTVFCDAKEHPFSSSASRAFYGFVNTGDVNNNFLRQWIWSGSTGFVSNSIYTSTSGPVAADFATSIANEQKRLAVAVKVNDFAKAYNGAGLATDVLGNTPNGIDAVWIGSSNSASLPLNGTIRRLTYFPQRLSNSTLQELTR